MIDQLIETLVKNPTEENQVNYLVFVNETEYSLLEDASKYPHKSQEYFDAVRKAFSYRKECAIKLIPKWIEKYGSTAGCPMKYEDTLNIPFKEIKKPKSLR